MRKFLPLAVAFICMAAITNAQIQKGSVLLGGNISGGTGRQTNSVSDVVFKQSGFSIAPSLGFVTANNKVWGLSLGTGFQKSSGSSQPTQNDYNNYSGNIFHRRYLTLGKGFYLFGQANAGYSYTKHKYVTPDNVYSRTVRTDMVSVSAVPGITYAVTKNFHLEAGLTELAYLSYSAQNETVVNGGTAITSKNKGLNFGTSFSSANPLSLGFRFVL